MGMANLLAGIVVLFFGAVVTYGASELSYRGDYGPGPGFLPLWIGIVLIGCAIVTILKAVRQYGTEKGRFIHEKTRQVASVFVTLIVTFLLVPALGLSLGLALFTGFAMRTTGRHGWILCLVTAVVTAAAVRVIFGVMLDLPLPKGVIGL
jgi:hypothetical protein